MHLREQDMEQPWPPFYTPCEPTTVDEIPSTASCFTLGAIEVVQAMFKDEWTFTNLHEKDICTLNT